MPTLAPTLRRARDWLPRFALAALLGASLANCASDDAGEATGSVSEADGVRYGCDYSFARPSPASLKSQGFTFAARYLSHSSGKNLSKSEADALIAAGIDVVSNFEDSATNALDGYNQGASDAKLANSQAASCGAPATRPIYFSVDFDATEGQQSAINSYFDGVASVIGRGRTGAYGGYYVIKRLFDAGKITWGWQAYAWSGGQWDSRAHMRQIQNGIDNDTLDKDEAIATDFGQWGHPTAKWAAKFVSQTYPYAADGPVKLTVGQTVKGNIVMENAGTQTWKAGVTKLAPIPRDKTNALASASWASPTRVSTLKADVAPGQKGTFEWDLTGSAKGDFTPFFGFVEEGVAWFADDGGPPDNDVEVHVVVSEAEYHAQFVSQTYPGAAKGKVALKVGETTKGNLVLKNIGTKPWVHGVTMLAPIPRDKPSALHASTWLSPTRIATIAADVAPGATATFEVDLTGSAAGETALHIGVVEEGVTWFADAPAGGGPADDVLAVDVVVSEGDGAGGAAASEGSAGVETEGTSAVGSDGETGETVVTGDGGASGTGGMTSQGNRDDAQTINTGSADNSGGCAVSSLTSRGDAAWWLGLAPMALLVKRRNRARR